MQATIRSTAGSVTPFSSRARSSKAVVPTFAPQGGARQQAARSGLQVSTESISRREIGAFLGLASLFLSSPAHAGLFGDDELVQNYTTETEAILGRVRDTLALARDDPDKDDKIKGLRKDINNWVAKYRREPKVSGKPSFGNTYSALNALAGHYNSFGTSAPVPKKRLERLNKELDDATLFLSRNR